MVEKWQNILKNQLLQSNTVGGDFEKSIKKRVFEDIS